MILLGSLFDRSHNCVMRRDFIRLRVSMIPKNVELTPISTERCDNSDGQKSKIQITSRSKPLVSNSDLIIKVTHETPADTIFMLSASSSPWDEAGSNKYAWVFSWNKRYPAYTMRRRTEVPREMKSRPLSEVLSVFPIEFIRSLLSEGEAVASASIVTWYAVGMISAKRPKQINTEFDAIGEHSSH